MYEMSEAIDETPKPYRRKSLRNVNINYRWGWFFVTFNVYQNKSIFGAIVGSECQLNALGRNVAAALSNMPTLHPEMYLDAHVVMPNHVHFICKIKDSPANDKMHLGKLVRCFKAYTAKLYRELRAAGQAPDIGDHLWQLDFWDVIVTKRDQLEGYRNYIRDNPRNWSRDRFGAVTSHHLGNLALLDTSLVGFIASQGDASAEKRLLWSKGEIDRGHAPVISTFTSPCERALLNRLLVTNRPFIRIYPGGLPAENELPAAPAAALAGNRALLISPSAPGTGLNKQRANWCNEYVIRQAVELWAGPIRPGGGLDALVTALRPRE